MGSQLVTWPEKVATEQKQTNLNLTPIFCQELVSQHHQYKFVLNCKLPSVLVSFMVTWHKLDLSGEKEGDSVEKMSPPDCPVMNIFDWSFERLSSLWVGPSWAVVLCAWMREPVTIPPFILLQVLIAGLQPAWVPGVPVMVYELHNEINASLPKLLYLILFYHSNPERVPRKFHFWDFIRITHEGHYMQWL